MKHLLRRSGKNGRSKPQAGEDRDQLGQLPCILRMDRTVPVPLLDQPVKIRRQHPAVGVDHARQHPGVLQDGNGLDIHILSVPIGLIQPYHLPDLFQAVQIIPAHDGLKGVVFLKHPVPHRIHDFLLGFEMVVNRSLGQPVQLVHDILDRGVLIALFQKQPLGGVQNPLHRDLRIFVPRHYQPLLS